MGIDVPSTWNNVFNLSVSTDTNDTTVRDYTATSNMIGSKLEDTIWHELTGYESASTINVFEEAVRNDIDLLMISSANVDTELLKLAYTDSVYDSLQTTIQNEISLGNIVIIPNTEVNINEWHGTGYISMNPSTGITTDKVINRTTGLILSGGYSTTTVNTMFLVNSIASIESIYGSIQIMYFGLASTTLNPVVGGVIFIYGTVGLIGSMYAYFENIDLMYQYMNGDQTAGASIVEDGVNNIVQYALSFGFYNAVKYVETPAIKSKYIDIYGEDIVNAISKADDSYIEYNHDTMLALQEAYEITSNIDTPYQLANLISNNPNLEIIIQKNTSDIVDLAIQQGYNYINGVAGLLEYNPKITIKTMIEHGTNGATVLAINGDDFIMVMISLKHTITMIQTLFRKCMQKLTKSISLLIIIFILEKKVLFILMLF